MLHETICTRFRIVWTTVAATVLSFATGLRDACAQVAQTGSAGSAAAPCAGMGSGGTRAGMMSQMMNGQSGMSCPCMQMMSGSMGWLTMVVGGILTLAAIAALIALTVFLIRRSRAELTGPGTVS